MIQKLHDQISELKKRNKMYEDIFDLVIQGVYIVDKNGQIVWFNRVMQELDGTSREAVIGKEERAVWENLNLNAGTVADTIRTGKQSEEKLFTYTSKTGRDLAVFMQSYPFYAESNLEYICSLVYYIDYCEQRLNKISEYRHKFSKKTVRIINNTNFTLSDVVGSSKEIRELIAMSRKAALKNSPIMIYGETGTGKEIIAQGIHNASMFNKGRFVAINCAAIPENLLETVLFGSVKGAFTGALDKPGLFEDANNGTIFLDELNSLPLSTQSKLLRVLQEKRACRIGDNHNYHINCRILSATNEEPHQLMKKGILRTDLYFRLAVVTLKIPPLSERKNDIPDLVKHFIMKYNAEYNLAIKTVDNDVFDVFNQYSWPGNVRELEHVIEYMINFTNSHKESLTFDELPLYLKEIASAQRKDHKAYLGDEGSLHCILEKFEKEVLESTLEQTQWNISQAARKLGIHREALYYRLKKFHLKK